MAPISASPVHETRPDDGYLPGDQTPQKMKTAPNSPPCSKRLTRSWTRKDIQGDTQEQYGGITEESDNSNDSYISQHHYNALLQATNLPASSQTGYSNYTSKMAYSSPSHNMIDRSTYQEYNSPYHGTTTPYHHQAHSPSTRGSVSSPAVKALEFGQSGPCTPTQSGQPSVFLVNSDLWSSFSAHTTEMIVTKTGRRMFPILQFSLNNLDRQKKYKVFIELVLADPHHWKFQNGQWMTSGHADTAPSSGSIYIHPDSPNTGAHWMKQDINFNKLKLTNRKDADKEGLVVVNSMHKYQPRIHVVEVLASGREKQIHMHSFAETEFITVTAYQNTDITQLKIDYNPFAKGFRENSDRSLSTAASHSVPPSSISSRPDNPKSYNTSNGPTPMKVKEEEPLMNYSQYGYSPNKQYSSLQTSTSRTDPADLPAIHYNDYYNINSETSSYKSIYNSSPPVGSYAPYNYHHVNEEFYSSTNASQYYSSLADIHQTETLPLKRPRTPEIADSNGGTYKELSNTGPASKRLCSDSANMYEAQNFLHREQLSGHISQPASSSLEMDNKTSCRDTANMYENGNMPARTKQHKTFSHLLYDDYNTGKHYSELSEANLSYYNTQQQETGSYDTHAWQKNVREYLPLSKETNGYDNSGCKQGSGVDSNLQSSLQSKNLPVESGCDSLKYNTIDYSQEKLKYYKGNATNYHTSIMNQSTWSSSFYNNVNTKDIQQQEVH